MILWVLHPAYIRTKVLHDYEVSPREAVERLLEVWEAIQVRLGGGKL